MCIRDRYQRRVRGKMSSHEKVEGAKELILARIEREDRELEQDPQTKSDDAQAKLLSLAKASEEDEQDCRLEYCRSLIRLRCQVVCGTSTPGCEQAIEELEAMVDKRERLWDCFMMMIEAHYHMGEYAQAEQKLSTVLAWNSRESTAMAWKRILEDGLMRDGVKGLCWLTGAVGLVTVTVAIMRAKSRAGAGSS
eukprot:TRINITY_DN16772_c0_g1_i2.p1 TRINITY_DN16772_c0_g1~~TRINITY_DN16772_c0_g1_i2.p1  ORF type:complete len:194 (+),score=60.25 TRINITY_DN16772_c0_g1_i2:109-690(+)